jgi:hypothetical protein
MYTRLGIEKSSAEENARFAIVASFDGFCNF